MNSFARWCLLLILPLGFMCGAATLAADKLPAQSGAPAKSDRQAEDTVAAIVKIKVTALSDARTTPFLGSEREGSGIVIDDRGHVLTIGYVVIEADSIQITGADGKTVPARLVGYDHASGFGLLRATLPLKVKPVPMGISAAVADRDPVLVVPYGGREAARLAFVVSRRAFTGSWEYLLDSAIFTTPPSDQWAGSALIDREGKLIGVGSLLVRDSAETETPIPGNMFVPIDLIKPILAGLIEKGRAPGPARPWLGLSTEEVQGHLLVSRVSPEGPAARAGVRPGDIVVGVGAEPVRARADLYKRVWGLGSAGVNVPLKVLQGTDVKDVKVRSIDRIEYFRSKPAY